MMIKSDKSQNKTILIAIAIALTFSLFFLSETSVSFGQTNASKSSISNISNNRGNSGSGKSNSQTNASKSSISNISNNSGRSKSNLKTTPLGIRISNFKTDPSTVHVGDNFTIGATITNNSPLAIGYYIDCFNTPFSVTFNKNVHTSTERGLAQCDLLLASPILLNPGEKILMKEPEPGIIYTASETGPTKAKVTFKYDTPDHIEKSVSKSFTFTILK